ncbi:MAG: 23S rRNA (adenine(2503)-C(2))-methyltransferase RlmN [Clostridiaceae bacterium]
MINILDLTQEDLKNWFLANNEKAFRAEQVFQWIYKGQWDFRGMKNINSSAIDKLSSNFYIGIPKVLEKLYSKDGTIKLLLALNDGNVIESVIMKYKHGNSICVSTQVGCRMGCKFCASTLDGRIRDLTAGEILSQILLAEEIISEKITNIVLMGSGEPLDNFSNVITFIELVNSPKGLNIGQRHITLSTCGLVPKIYELADKRLQITLAISLHAADDVKRKKMMPIANKYSIKEVLQACKYYTEKTNRRITFEYALVKGSNDRKEDAYKLCDLLKGTLSHVNLIPINEVTEREFKRSEDRTILEFYNILTSKGIETTIRREMGSDINAACGQLRRSYIDATR